ncbi:MAG: LamG domain-containing protein [Candidatus Heimdallarchaeota archaeon]
MKYWLVLITLLLIPTALAVSIETSNYKIECWPEYATLRPSNVGYEQYCLFENKQNESIDTDFAMLFENKLRTGKAKILTSMDEIIEYSYFCNSETYGILDNENVYCTLPNGTVNTYTGTERAFEVLGFGAIVHYNISYSHNYWNDITGAFNFFDASGFTDKGNAYYVEDVTWQPYEEKLVKFNYLPKNPTSTVKWDAVFGDFSEGEINLNLDPLTNPYLYESDWQVDVDNASAIVSNASITCLSGKLMDNMIYYYTFDDADLISGTHPIDIHSYLFNGTNINGAPTGQAGKLNECFLYQSSDDDAINTVHYLKNSYGGFGISLWFKANSNPVAWQAIFGTGSSLDADWAIKLMTDGTINTNIRSDSGTFSDILYSPSDIADGTFHHVAVSYNNESFLFSLYIDGIHVDNATVDLTSFNMDRVAYIGARNDKGVLSQPFDGWIDEVVLYNQSLIPSTVSYIYSSGSGTSYPFVESNNSCFYNTSKFEINWNRANITYTKSVGDSNFTLYCNGTSYIYSIPSSSGTFENVCSNGITNVNMSYKIDLNATSSFYSVTMQSTSSSSLNITFKDSETKQIITSENVSLEIIGDYLSRSYATSNGTIHILNLEKNNYTLRYRGETYPEKFHYINLDSSQEIILYLTNTSTAENVTITVLDQIGNEVENALVKALRYDIVTNSYLLDEAALTSYQGEVYFNLVLNSEYYKFIVEYPVGTLQLETSGSYLTNNEIILRINTGSGLGNDYEIANNVVTNFKFLNDSNNFRLFFNGDSVDYACIEVFTVDSVNGNTLYNRSCSYGTTGTFFVGIQAVNGTTYKAKAIMGLQESDKVYFIGELWKSFTSSNPFGNSGVLLAFFALVLAGLIGYLNMYFGILAMSVQLTMLKLFGLLNWGWESFIAIWIISLVLIYILSKSGGNNQ